MSFMRGSRGFRSHVTGLALAVHEGWWIIDPAVAEAHPLALLVPAAGERAHARRQTDQMVTTSDLTTDGVEIARRRWTEHPEN